MEKPKLEDFNLSEEKLLFIEKFAEKKERNETVGCCILFIISFIIISSWIDNMTSVWLVLLLIYLLFAIPIWLGNRINIYLLSSSKNYSLYSKGKEDKKKYQAQLEEHKKYLEKIRREEARKIINQNLECLLDLKQKIFNKSIDDDSYDDFLEFQNTVRELGKYKEDMTWKEQDYYYNFEKYLQSRERQLEEMVQKHKIEKKEKEVEEVDIEEITGIGKIVVDDSENDYNKEGEEVITTERIFAGRKVDFEEVNKENASLGLKGEKGILNYEKESLHKNRRSDLAEKVKHISEDEGAGTGFDILSFNFNGNPKYIEVKTTRGGKKTPFFLSENEVAFMEHEPENCCIYRLYNFNDEKGTGSLIVANGYEEIKYKFNLKASQFKVKIK